MSNDLWFHALKVLDSLRTSSAKDESEFNFKESFYKFEDDTDILKKHREHLEKKYTEEHVDVKTMYIELIRMMLDRDRQQKEIKSVQETENMEKIQGFQELTNRLFFNLNEKYSLQLEQMNNKIDFLKTDYENKLNEIEKKNYNLEKKNEDLESKLGQFQDDQRDLESKLGQFQDDQKDLESKLGQFQDDQKDKFDEMNNNIADNRVRVEHLEGEVNDIQGELKAKEDTESTENDARFFVQAAK